MHAVKHAHNLETTQRYGTVVCTGRLTAAMLRLLCTRDTNLKTGQHPENT